MKQLCSKCEELKDICFFYKDKSSNSGYRPDCKNCVKERRKEYYNINKENEKVRSKEYRDRNKEQINVYQAKYRGENKAVISNKQKLFYIKNRDKVKGWHKRYAINNKDKINLNIKKYVNENRKKVRAKGVLNYQVKIGNIIKPKKCECCNQTNKLDGHHYNYSMPKDVVWLCRCCHINLHKSGLAMAKNRDIIFTILKAFKQTEEK